ncbi:c-type cytochrome [Rufibacter latericius]|uniref:Cytochrome c n=1 Tax=Rufibacter latericius TaxID=2487040 RepID=A0A3M9MU16_9BACT|nr:c-type cytochrome [Rufibacter latericius]RNI28685.1 cytochrome c [Rufibacter latericius]
MVKKILKWTGLVLGSLVLIGVLFYFYASHSVEQRIKKKYSFVPEKINVTQDSVLISKGAHLAAIKGCTGCHGDNMAGKVMIDDAPLGRLVSSNLTKGKGGLPASYTTEDWVRALRHGVGQDGLPLLLMPSHETTLLSEDDLTALIAYCQSLKPVDKVLPGSDLGPVVKVMTHLGKMPLLPVEQIDHAKPMMASVANLEGAAYGKYLAISCTGCHHADLKGGEPVAPGLPQVANITRSGNVGKWTQAQFIQTLRTGKTPEGKVLDNEEMPWKMTAQYTDKELAAIYEYCQSLK